MTNARWTESDWWEVLSLAGIVWFAGMAAVFAIRGFHA